MIKSGRLLWKWLIEAKNKKEDDSWIDDVKVKWHPPEGLFTKSPRTIAKTIADASKDCRQAISRANFFYNRYGCTTDPERMEDDICKKREEVLNLIRKYKCEEE